MEHIDELIEHVTSNPVRFYADGVPVGDNEIFSLVEGVIKTHNEEDRVADYPFWKRMKDLLVSQSQEATRIAKLGTPSGVDFELGWTKVVCAQTFDSVFLTMAKHYQLAEKEEFVTKGSAVTINGIRKTAQEISNRKYEDYRKSVVQSTPVFDELTMFIHETMGRVLHESSSSVGVPVAVEISSTGLVDLITSLVLGVVNNTLADSVDDHPLKSMIEGSSK